MADVFGGKLVELLLVGLVIVVRGGRVALLDLVVAELDE